MWSRLGKPRGETNFEQKKIPVARAAEKANAEVLHFLENALKRLGHHRVLYIRYVKVTHRTLGVGGRSMSINTLLAPVGEQFWVRLLNGEEAGHGQESHTCPIRLQSAHRKFAAIHICDDNHIRDDPFVSTRPGCRSTSRDVLSIRPATPHPEPRSHWLVPRECLHEDASSLAY